MFLNLLVWFHYICEIMQLVGDFELLLHNS